MNYLNLIRYKNLIFLTFLMCLMHYTVASPLLKVFKIESVGPDGAFWLMTIGVVLIAAAGYAINDYFDTKIDALNKPDKVIVGVTISRDATSRLYQILMGAGIACGIATAIWAKSLSIGLIFIIAPGLLWFYSASYKRQFLIGHLIVSLCSALAILLVAEFEASFLTKNYGIFVTQAGVNYNLYLWIGGFALFAFLLTFIREIVKDIEDEYGDRELESRTMPVVWGAKKTKVFLYAVIFITILCALAFTANILFPSAKTFTFLGREMDMLSFRYVLCAVVAPLLVTVILLARAKRISDYTQISKFVKFIMLTGALYSVIFYFQLARVYGLQLFNLFIIK